MLAPLLALLACLGPVQDHPATPADLAGDVARAERIGRALFESDQAAWHATDALAEAKGPLEKLGLGGFFARKGSGAGWTVLFLSRDPEPRILQQVEVAGGERKPKVLDTPSPLPLSKADAQLWAARQLAIESGGPYEQPINPVVLRGSDFGEKGILVYLLGGTDKPDVAVLGRHVRVRVSDDGTRADEVLPLVKAVIESPTRSAEGQPVAALMASQLATDFPSEAQVFVQLNAGLPFYVATRRGLWQIDQGKIAYLGEKPPAKATLQLSLREAGSVREGGLQLWRVEIPAEPGFTAGDEYIGSFHAGAEGVAIPDLVPGRYRALCEAHSCRAAPLAAFEVKAPRTELALEVVSPRGREVWVDLVDVHGVGFETAQFMYGGRSGRQRLPDWLHPRSKIEADGSIQTIGVGGGLDSSSVDRGWRKLKRGEHGFAIGPVLEDGSIYETSSGFQLRVPEHGTVSGTLRNDGHDEQRFRMLLVEKGSLEGLFTLPDGKPVDLNYVRLETPLEPDTQPRPAQWWLDVPVSISVTVPGYERLEFVQRLREGPVKPRTLEKKP